MHKKQENKISLGQYVAQKRESLGLSLEQLAEKSGLDIDVSSKMVE